MRLAHLAHLAVPLLFLSARAAEASFPFVMPWDDNSLNLTNLSDWNDKPAGKRGFIRVRDGKLFAGDERIRLLGVNIVFGSSQVPKEEADKVAARLARFGVNIVRLHHMDSSPTPRGILQKDRRTLDPEAMDKLDYFVSALKREGIYVDLNLHVGRVYPGFPDWGEKTPRYWKGVDNFHPGMIAMQRDFARDLLTHRNAYTGNRYVDEPAVAEIEINNENGLLRTWRDHGLDGMTEPYRGELRARWATWLKTRYRTDAALKTAWGVIEEPIGSNLLTDAIVAKSSERGWWPQFVKGAAGSVVRDGAVVRLTATKPGSENWHTQLHQSGLSLRKDKPYTLALRLRADHPIKPTIALMQAHEPWKRMWSREVAVGTEWTEFRFSVAVPFDDDRARLTLTGIGGETGTLEVDRADLLPGGRLGLAETESLAAGVDPFQPADGGARTPSAWEDWARFLWETEAAYWAGMTRYLREDLGAKPLIVGTQAGYSPAPMQATMDMVDNHAYWQHPRFPHKQWDMDDWNIVNTPMSGRSDGGTLPDLALRRVPGKPYEVTEYNHSFPSFYQAEGLPLLGAYAAFQNWDGIFLYSWGSHLGGWNPGYVANFFDSHANPVKTIGLITAAALFRRGDVSIAPPAGGGVPLDLSRWIRESIIGTGQLPSAERFGAPRSAAFVRSVGIDTPPGPERAPPFKSVTGQLEWGFAGRKLTTIDTPRTKALIGEGAGPVRLGDVTMELVSARNDTAVLSASVMEGKGFGGPARVLFSTLGRVENTGEEWNADETSLGRKLGRAPVLIEGVSARLTLPVPASRVDAWALDERGNRRGAVRVTGDAVATVVVDENDRSPWYEVEIR